MSKNKNGKLFMAFGKTQASSEGGSVSRLYGVGSFFVRAVNPTKAELEQLIGRPVENEPEYVKEVEVTVGEETKKVKQAIVRVWVQLDPNAKSNNGRDDIFPINFNIRNAPSISSKGTIRVLNDYGESTYIPLENAKAGTVPEDQNWFPTKGLRPALQGEENLLNFLKKLLVVPDRTVYNSNTGERVPIANLADAEARLEKIQDYFKGDVSEVKRLFALQPNNKVKGLLYVREDIENNRLYQGVYTSKFLKNGATNYSYLEKEVNDAIERGSFRDSYFRFGDIEVYDVASTSFNGASQSAPVDSNSTSTGGWFDN